MTYNKKEGILVVTLPGPWHYVISGTRLDGQFDLELPSQYDSMRNCPSRSVPMVCFGCLWEGK